MPEVVYDPMKSAEFNIYCPVCNSLVRFVLDDVLVTRSDSDSKQQTFSIECPGIWCVKTRDETDRRINLPNNFKKSCLVSKSSNWD